MKEAYLISQSLDEFSAAREQFAHLVGALRSGDTLGMEHGDVEKLISKEGNELLRRLLQGHLDLRASREEKREEVRGSDGVVRARCREGCERALMSLFGEVVVRRKGYGAPGVSSLFVLDAQLNLPPDKYSHGLRQRISEEVAKGSFDAAVAGVERSTGGKVPKRQAEELAAEVSRDFEAFYETRRCPTVEATADPLVMSADGKGIVMRKEGLREGTRKAAERAGKQRKTRLGRGEKKNRKRMAMVAAIYSVAPRERTAEAIMGVEEAPEQARPRVRNKRVWASVERDPEIVIDELFAEARERDPQQQRPRLMLVDGHPEQLRYIRAAIERYGVSVTLILDFIHVLEYIWKAAYCFHAPGTDEAEAWVCERALQVLKGHASQVAAGMRRSATLQALKPSRRLAVDKCADYLLTYKHMLRYDEYLSRGWPIATGVIEGACRHLVKDRMDITGARWGLQRAEAVLKLRSLRSSGDADVYWDFYKTRALCRNHASRYEDAPLQDAA